MNFWRNPPPHLREREAARFPAWLQQIGLSLPKLEVLRTEVRALGDDTWRIRFAVARRPTRKTCGWWGWSIWACTAGWPGSCGGAAGELMQFIRNSLSC